MSQNDEKVTRWSQKWVKNHAVKYMQHEIHCKLKNESKTHTGNKNFEFCECNENI